MFTAFNLYQVKSQDIHTGEHEIVCQLRFFFCLIQYTRLLLAVNQLLKPSLMLRNCHVQ